MLRFTVAPLQMASMGAELSLFPEMWNIGYPGLDELTPHGRDIARPID